jgi:small subunit ribosomal protein S7
MPRKAPSGKRDISADPVYHSVIVTQVINKVLKDGKKTVAESIVYGALDGVKEKIKGEKPVDVLQRALDNVKPSLEVRSRRVGGATYQVPVEVKKDRANTLAIRWLIDYSRVRREQTMKDRLMHEIMDASNGIGAAVKRREDVHKMAEANKAFAHYRW